MKDKDITSAWSRAWLDEIQDFKAEIKREGEIVEEKMNVFKREYIDKAPEMLIFQINRVKYTEKFETEKINDNFIFDTELYIDQFLQDNSDLMVQDERKLIEIREQIQELEFHQQKFDNFYGEKQSILGKK